MRKAGNGSSVDDEREAKEAVDDILKSIHTDVAGDPFDEDELSFRNDPALRKWALYYFLRCAYVGSLPFLFIRSVAYPCDVDRDSRALTLVCLCIALGIGCCTMSLWWSARRS